MHVVRDNCSNPSQPFLVLLPCPPSPLPSPLPFLPALFPWRYLLFPPVPLSQNYLQVLDTNLVGPFLVAQAVARSMVRNKRGGSIINISSVSGMVPSSGETQHQAGFFLQW